MYGIGKNILHIYRTFLITPSLSFYYTPSPIFKLPRFYASFPLIEVGIISGKYGKTIEILLKIISLKRCMTLIHKFSKGYQIILFEGVGSVLHSLYLRQNMARSLVSNFVHLRRFFWKNMSFLGIPCIKFLVDKLDSKIGTCRKEELKG